MASSLGSARRLAAIAALVVSARLPAQSAPRDSILGQWTGTSTCVKAPWNAACNDEQIVYDFERSATNAGGVLLHAAKVVNGVVEPMGDLELQFDAATNEWAGDFSNPRVRIRWLYSVSGPELTGRVVFRDTGRVARQVRAHRRPPR